MPSGAKKRKAARRKKEMGIHPPDSPTNPSPGNGESHDSKGETSDEGEDKKGESPRSESVAVTAMDHSENGKEKPGEETAKVTENPPKEEKEEKEKEKEKEKLVEEVAIPVSREAEDVSVELVQSEKEEVGGSGGGGGGEGSTEVAEGKSVAVASVVPVHEPVSVTEEVIEPTKAGAVTSEALAQESEAKPVPISDTPPAPVIEQSQPRESGELYHESERSEAAPAPLVEHRATWWNCCGLFDVFTSSRDASRT